MQKLTYTVKETAEILNIGISKAYDMVRQDIIPNLKMGKRIVVPIRALNEWLDNCFAGANNER